MADSESSNEDDIEEIADITRKYDAARSKNDTIAYGFEGISGGGGDVSKTKRKGVKRKKSPSTGQSSVPNKRQRVTNTKSTTPSTIVNVASSASVPSTSNQKQNDQFFPLWKCHANSKTSYLSQYFKACSGPVTGNDKIDVKCKLCDNDVAPLSITYGNNSNLVKHMKSVSMVEV